MEALGAVIGAMLAKPFEIIFGSMHARIKNFRKRESNFKTLQDETNILILIKGVVERKLGLQEQMESAPQARVKYWVTQVNKLQEQVKAMKSSVSTSDGAYDFKCSCSAFPMLCKLSNRLVKKMEEVKQLTEAGKSFANKTSGPEKLIHAENISGSSVTGQKTASENLTKLLDLLKDEKVTRIGVYGMGGVGKTTLVQNLNNKLKEEPSTHSFSIIIWVTVSKDANPRKIQTRIAERLNLEVKNEESEETVASRLYRRLRKEKCFLLILDDVWNDIDLQKLGIPNPEECPRSKILITSRSVDVCRRMWTQDEFKVNVLNYEEAWDLFQKHAGEVAVREEVQALAEEVANECAGLPLAIITVGASMRGKSDVRIWKDALRALQMSVPDLYGIEEKVFKSLKWSYDSLASKITQSCFLFCCLYPEDYDISVRELVRYWYCEGLLDERLNYEERENRGIAIIQGLRYCCLLEEGLRPNTVKVHDVVRDVGKWIACSSEDECRSLVRSGIGLTCVTKEELSHSYKRVSFMDNRILNLPACVVQCPEASTLLLQGNRTLEIIPISFLQGFESLKILDLSYSKIESLPSLDGLNQLRALILHDCSRLKELPALDGLSGLLVLDCGGTGITQLPVSLERLSNLRQLDLSDSSIQTFPYIAISRLHKLELLNLWRLKTPLEGQRIFKEVVPLLKHLTMFYACVDSIPLLDSNHLNSLERIKELHISTKDSVTEIRVKYEEDLILGGLLSPMELIECSLRKAPKWSFVGCVEFAQTLKKLAVNAGSCFASLKVLGIASTAFSFRANDTGASFDLLPNLEEIKLFSTPDLESVSDFGNILGLSFSRLRVIHIVQCDQLKCVFSLKENQKLEKLQVMSVNYCRELECLFQSPQGMGLVPNIQEVTLVHLPDLGSLSRNCTESWKNLRRLEVIGCDGIRKLPMEAKNAQEIIGGADWWNQLEWDTEDTKLLLQRRFKPRDALSYTIIMVDAALMGGNKRSGTDIYDVGPTNDSMYRLSRGVIIKLV